MLEASRTSTGKAIVSFNRRYFPQILAVRRILQARGGATHVSAIYHKRTFGWSNVEGRKVAPHPIICDAIHHVDLLRWLAGREEAEAADVDEVHADSWSGAREGTPCCNAIIRFANGCRGVMMSHYGVGERVQRADAHAEEFSVYLDLTRGVRIELFVEGRLQETPLDLQAVGGERFNETQHFVDCILNDAQPWSSLDDAVKTMELCEAIEKGH
jgi:predicted dehydrogenase